MDQDKTVRVLFVCLGNICRSPMAEAVFRQLVKEAGLSDGFDVESAGTSSEHSGGRPHPGTLEVLRRHQIDTNGKRARQISPSDLREFDYIVAMDEENVADLAYLSGRVRYGSRKSSGVNEQHIPRLLEFAPQSGTLDVPDPYYTGNFDQVYRLVLAGCQGLLAHIRQERGL